MHLVMREVQLIFIETFKNDSFGWIMVRFHHVHWIPCRGSQGNLT
jgi:hypothetical protein